MNDNDFPEYFYTQVIIPYREFRKSILSHDFGNKNDKRLALTAAIQLYHLQEHLPPDVTIPFDEIAKFNPDLDLVGAITMASKHGTLTNPRWNRLIIGSDCIEEFMIICVFEDGEGEYIVYSGDLHMLSTLTENNGKYHLSYHINSQKMKGVGMKTGDKYQVNYINNRSINHDFDGLPYGYDWSLKLTFSGPGSDNNLVINIDSHTKINANGEVTTTLYDYTTTCK